MWLTHCISCFGYLHTCLAPSQRCQMVGQYLGQHTYQDVYVCNALLRPVTLRVALVPLDRVVEFVGVFVEEGVRVLRSRLRNDAAYGEVMETTAMAPQC